MLEVRNLCKTYRSKDGVSVEATKDISLRFPERGMVFLLGRSGSGKSTLLHLLGGLDRYDSGEILINGTSTKEFSNSMMDSYRNTYVGFVFQDYNILRPTTASTKSLRRLTSRSTQSASRTNSPAVSSRGWRSQER